MSDGPRSKQPEPMIDPRGLITDAFAMEGVVEADCRSIFFDWALGLDPSVDQRAAIETLIAQFADRDPNHPMHAVLLEGVGRREGAAIPRADDAGARRRGGRRRNHPDGDV